MTPYELDRALEKHRRRMQDANGEGGLKIVTVLIAISESLEAILQHLSDVESDLNLARKD